MAAAFGWKRAIGAALIRRFGLPRVEAALNGIGLVWQPERKQWAFEDEAAVRAA